jgi:cytochrome c oxidase assembly protein subunit 15
MKSGVSRSAKVKPPCPAAKHADVVIAFVGLTVAFWLGARLTSAPTRTQRAALLLLAACALQGAVGYTQYFTGLPTVLVSVHMLGACLIWITTLAVWLSTRAPRGAAATATAAGSVVG